jgi:hypothetical protein
MTLDLNILHSLKQRSHAFSGATVTPIITHPTRQRWSPTNPRCSCSFHTEYFDYGFLCRTCEADLTLQLTITSRQS